MREYVLRRLFLLLPTVLGVTLVVFLMMRFIPGDPVTNMMGEMFSQEDADLGCPNRPSAVDRFLDS
jgi:ABC-type microcin C transport system permease subunit YejB